jgi:hypothetical protein
VNTREPPTSVPTQTARHPVQPGPNAFAQQPQRGGAQVALEDRAARGQPRALARARARPLAARARRERRRQPLLPQAGYSSEARQATAGLVQVH